MPAYAVLGATGNTGTALIRLLLQSPDNQIHAFCRDKAKLARLLPEAVPHPNVQVYEGSITDVPLIGSAIRGTRAVFLVTSTNDNVPGFRVGQDVALSVLQALREDAKLGGPSAALPKLILLSSATLDDVLSSGTPRLLRRILLWSASNVYEDLRRTEAILRAEEDWVTTIYIKPGALSVDIQRGHALSLTEESSPLSYLDLAAGMIEAADDGEGKWDYRNVGVINTNGRAKFPQGTVLCIITGLLRHFFPSLHPHLPSTGPG
ncbi:NAD-dependent epimerase/ dehydratase [Echria macrotheca]|uniref:NAD-dependent epimerase/ dehydratase n=1 Tax=Echria macrotheca TaxID=438768 RepID=A0AAJ0F2P4_9PEZI|nr:NAD-dependent epimerase/ dehydratase [Echria macrotheca]